jgi:hypothetical protein
MEQMVHSEIPKEHFENTRTFGLLKPLTVALGKNDYEV